MRATTLSSASPTKAPGFVSKALALPVENAWKPAVKANLEVSLRLDETANGLRPVQHQFGVGQVGERGPVRAFEIFAATRFGEDTGQTGDRPVGVEDD